MKSCAELLLRIIESGERVTHQGVEYAMSEDGGLCMVAHDEQGEERVIGIPCDMAAFHAVEDARHLAEESWNHWVNVIGLEDTK